MTISKPLKSHQIKKGLFYPIKCLYLSLTKEVIKKLSVHDSALYYPWIWFILTFIFKARIRQKCYSFLSKLSTPKFGFEIIWPLNHRRRRKSIIEYQHSPMGFYCQFVSTSATLSPWENSSCCQILPKDIWWKVRIVLHISYFDWKYVCPFDWILLKT